MNNPFIINPFLKYLIQDCYQEDYDPFYAEFWYDNYCYTFSFSEWYFFYRERHNLHYRWYRDKKINKYKYTPEVLSIR
jgi:hypothetical protein